MQSQAIRVVFCLLIALNARYALGAASTTTSISSNFNPAVFGQTVTFTATVDAGATGTVTFSDGSTVLGSSTLNGATTNTAVFNYSSLSVGVHSITADYTGDTNFATSTSSPLTQTISQAASSTALISSNLNTVFGQSVMLTATVTAVSPGVGTPTKTVVFLDSGTPISGNVNLNGSGATTFTTNTLTVGTHTLTAQYSGDSNFVSSTSSSISQIVAQGATSTGIVGNPNPSLIGQSVTVTVSVSATAPATGTPTGTVTVKDNGTAIGAPLTLTNGLASFVQPFSFGAHPLTADYNGDARFATSSGAATQNVGLDVSSTTLTSSSNPSSPGAQVTFTATVSAVAPATGTPTGLIQFLDNGTLIQSVPLNGAGVATFSTTSLSTGFHPLTASYGGSATFAGSTSTTLNQSIHFPSSTAASSGNPSAVFGQSVTFTATVTSPNGTPTGTVTFMNGAANLGTGTLVGGVATFTSAALTPGIYSITAVYPGDANFSTSTSVSLVQTINKSLTTTSNVTSTAVSAVYSQPVTLTANIAVVAPGAGTPTGNVQFMDGGNPLGAPVALAGGIATLVNPVLTVGTHSITATYLGDNTDFTGSSSVTPLSQTISTDGTSTSFSPANPPNAVFGQSVTFTTHITPMSPGIGIPTGSVTLKEAGNALGVQTLDASGNATFTISSLALGAHSLTIVYAGDGNFLTSTSPVAIQTISTCPTNVAITSTPNPATDIQTITFTVTVSASGGGSGTPTGSIQLSDNGVNIGPVTPLTNGIATIVAGPIGTVGAHPITATYSGDSNFNGAASSAYPQQVLSPTSITVVSSNPNSKAGENVTFTATLTSLDAGAPTGTITFKDGSTILGSPTITSNGNIFTGTFSTSTLTQGSHSITAVYDGDAFFITSTSPVITQTVSQAGSLVTITSPTSDPTICGQFIDFSVLVSAVAPSTGTPSGTITLKDGSNILATATLSSGTASFSVTSLAVGPHSISADFSGDANYFGATSTTLVRNVTQDNTTTTVKSSSTGNSSQYGQSVTFTATIAGVAPGGNAGAPGPAGAVTFAIDGTAQVPDSTAVNGIATLTTSILSAGSHAVTATYSGDSNYFASPASGPTTQTVSQATSATTLISSGTPAQPTSSVTFTATVTFTPAAAIPTGNVTFFDGATPLGAPATLTGTGPYTATFTTSTLASGIHSITASYGNDTNITSSTSSAVTQEIKFNTTTALSASPNSTVFGQSVTFTANVTPGATGIVTFNDGLATLGSAPILIATNSATFTTSGLAVGNHTITANYGGDAHYVASSGTLPGGQTVNQAATTASLASSLNPSTYGSAVTFTSVVTATSPGVGTPTGTVTFLIDTVPQTPVAVTGGSAIFTISNLTAGIHSVDAIYNGDTNFSTSSASTLSQTVNLSSSAVAINASPNPALEFQQVTITATVSGPGTPTGNVTFAIDGTPQAPASLTNGVATISTSTLSIGSHTVDAAYAGDPNFQASTAATAVIIVNPAPPVITSPLIVAGNTNLQFNYNATATGSSPIFYTASPLPAGLTATSNGNISGLPTAAGQTLVTLTATNASGITDIKTLEIDISTTPVINSSLTATGITGTPFVYDITALGIPTPVFTASPLPFGLISTNGNSIGDLILGVPAASGTTNVTLTATNTGGTDTQTLVITVYDPTAITSSLSAAGVVGTAFDYAITSTGSAPITYSVDTLPPGLALNVDHISGTPTSGGSFNVTITATGPGGTDSKVLTITIATPPTITSSLSASAIVNENFSYTITANGDTPVTFTVSALPAGLTFDGTATISGIPTIISSVPVTLTATNAAGVDTETLQLTVTPQPPTITSALIAKGQTGQSFTYTLVATGSVPIVYSTSTLPAGFQFINGDTIAGIPSVVGDFPVLISAANSAGNDIKFLVISITQGPVPPTITSPLTATGTAGVPFRYNITASGDMPMLFAATGLPTGFTLQGSVISGTPTDTLTASVNLTVTNNSGNFSDSKILVITINPAPPVITSAVSATGVAGQPFSFELTATGTAPITFSTSALPTGLSFSGSTISGTPKYPQTTDVTITASNLAGTVTQTLTIGISNGNAPAFTSPTTASGTAGQVFAFTVTASNKPISFNATNLPPGFAFDPIAGVISGVFLGPGVFSVDLSATNAAGTGFGVLVITATGNDGSIPIIVSDAVANGAVNQPFVYGISVRGSMPITLAATGLPDGLSLTGSQITGIPTTQGQWTVTLSASNTFGKNQLPLVISIFQVAQSALDSDGDGIPDAVEIAAGSLPDNPQNTPFGGSSVTQAKLILGKMIVRLNFAKSGQDSISFDGTLPIPDGFSVNGQVVTVAIGNVAQRFSLNASGIGVPSTPPTTSPASGFGSFKLRVKSKKDAKGTTTVAAQDAPYTIVLSKGDFASTLAGNGLTNATVKNAIELVPVIILFNMQFLETNERVSYTATAKRSGIARSSN